MANNRILFLAPASIPVYEAEAIVNVKLLKLLVSKGYRIDVISKKAKWKRYPLMLEDELQKELSSVTIIEVDNKINFSTLWLHLRGWLRFGVFFKGIHWAFLASRKAESLIRSNDYGCVMTKNTPSEVVGRWIKRRYGIPWIATWNDPYPLERYPEPYGEGPDAKLSLLKRPLLGQMKEADAHVYPSARLRDYMQGYMQCPPEKTFVVPHIVEHAADAERVRDGGLKICYVGSLIDSRKPWTLLDAVSLFRQKHGETAFSIDFVGDVPSNMKDVIEEKGLSGTVKVLPPVSYTESMKLLGGYDVSLIIEAPCKEGIFLPSKVSDAMAMGLTVFAVSPAKGVLRDLYESGYVQYFSDVTDVASIVDAFEKLVSDYNSGKMSDSSIPVDYEPKTIGDQYDKIIGNL
ncbi:MAG: glycosyltransferase family 4 protein [Bacteroidaceae bacterium]|nr:glycosyltransferase family 4 protein [Bacteroidaceae bacterium]